MPVRTVIDSCVLRSAFEGEEGEINKRALAVLDDTDREFIAVDFVALETIPKPTFNKRQEQALIFRTFFEEAPLHAEVSTAVTNLAMKLGCDYDIDPMDALIVSSAIVSGADELITMEKPTKPMFRVKSVKVISLQSPIQ